MFTRISSITLAILLLVLFGSQANSHANLYVVVAELVVLIVATLAINFKRLNFTWPHLLLPTIFLLGVGSVFVVIPNTKLQIFFLILSAIMFYFLEMKLGRESHFLQNIYLLSVFALYLGLFAVEFYFNLQVWWLVIASFVLTYVLAIQGFAGFSLPAKRYFYILLALIVSEATWGLAFWPTHFFVDSVVVFCIFYLLWLFSFSAFFGKLSRAKIYLQLAFVSIVLFITLASAAWLPLH